MNRVEIVQAGARFVAELAGLAQKQDVNVLLAPDNLLIDDTKVELRSQTPAPGAPVGVYPGFSAPEVHAGAPAPNSGVYFVGAVLYMLVTGSPPPPAPARQPGPLFSDGKLLSQVINQALEPDPRQRFAGFAPLEGALKAVLAQAQAPAAPPPVAEPAKPQASVAPPPAAAPAAPKAPAAPPPVAEPAKPQASVAPPPAAAPAAPPVTAPAVPPPASGKAQAYTAPGQPPAPPYLAGPSQGLPPPPPLPVPPKKKKKTGLIVTLCVVGGLVLALGGLVVYTFVQKGNADTAYTEQRYADYVSTVDSLPWMKLFMGGEVDMQYANANARQLMDNSESTAQEVLDAILALDAVEGSDKLVRDVRDDWVDTLTRRGGYEEALEVTDSLQAKHPDSVEIAKEVRYQWAQAMLNDGRYEEALDLLDQLGAYKDSVEMAQPVRYDWAISLLHDGDLQGSLAMFEQVGDYLDSREQVDNIHNYTAALEQTDPAARYNAFHGLGNFLDAPAQAETAAAGIYESGVQLYREQQFDQAYDLLDNISDYADVWCYVQAMDVYFWNSDNYQSDSYYDMETLRELSYNIDMRPIIMTSRMLWGFLIGDWESSDGGGEFYLSSSEYEFSAFPEVTGTYVFDHECMYPDEGNDGPSVYFEYIDFDSIYVNVTSTGVTHQFTRA